MCEEKRSIFTSLGAYLPSRNTLKHRHSATGKNIENQNVKIKINRG